MNNLYTPCNKGFMLLVPLLLISFVLLSFFYVLMYKVESFSYSITRYEQFINEKHARTSCQNTGALYKSYDPHFLIIC